MRIFFKYSKLCSLRGKWVVLLMALATAALLIFYPSTAVPRKGVGLLKQRAHRTAYDTFTDVHPTGKIILYWTTFFGEDFGDVDAIRKRNIDPFDAYLEDQSFSQCPVGQCFATNDRSLLNQSAALIFHSRDIKSADLPNVRFPDQRWIFYNLEPPQLTTLENSPLESVNDVFNWTMTYRRDSDVYHPYSADPFRRMAPLPPTWQQLRSKTKKVAWIVSNCGKYVTSQRMEYVHQLRKYIQVDIYGKCGTKTCTDRPTCYRMLSADYKFYLSFENSLCRDYVTEKFFNILAHDVVPVVYGGANYSAFISPDAFIDARQFKSARDLANHLNYLDGNLTAYESYFQWRRAPASWREISRQKRHFCQLCQMLHDKSLARHTYEDIHGWWYNDSCTMALPSIN